MLSREEEEDSRGRPPDISIQLNFHTILFCYALGARDGELPRRKTKRDVAQKN